MLSIERVFSMMYPAKYSPAVVGPAHAHTKAPKARPRMIQKPLESEASRKEISFASRWSTKRSSASIARMKTPNVIQAHMGKAVTELKMLRGLEDRRMMKIL